MVNRKETNRVIFHHSLAECSTVEQITLWHKERGFDTVGYHNVILKDGTIQKGRDYRTVGAHCLGRNDDSIGVCFEGDFSKHEPTEAQYQAAGQIYHDYCRAYQKTLEAEFHRNMDNPCPGRLFDRNKLLIILDQHNPYKP